MGGRPTADAVSGESNHWLPILYRVVLILGYRLLAISFEPKARMIACVSDMPAAIRWSVRPCFCLLTFGMTMLACQSGWAPWFVFDRLTSVRATLPH